ncbi:P-type DNA transfer protein VirB5 [Salmonella enterica]|uniref:Conjugal transfer protein n=1 Tax=Providencia rettgeri TaxID=587 RepID=B2G2P8_PRORE|nr:P-type DNA transfer protein VirB5 [Providencia rettgeri]EBP5855033.1 P-type DNA transfer protein VirB5 [Salmonella enterica]HAZ7996807.1 P-type DNA transfer protein VirB5 [Escherichia coli]EBP5855744.1 P-type DNA transfer protein VirB5 [Salmonella enterica]EEF7217820.1 P-type DNA transfer protein VirB5 [Salmonella enterica]CAQ48362.1 conjugal transfer protein [Providencia rettgeri]
MKKLVMTAAVAAILGAASPVMAQGIPVFDGTRAADFLQQFARMKEQLDTAKDQLAEAQRMYEAVTGDRGLGNLMRNAQLREFLPDDLRTVYDSANGGGYAGISGSINDILRDERLNGSVADMRRSIEERSRTAAATDKAVGLRAYEGAQQRLAQIEGLMDEISRTQDQKAIEELQARIAGEQAAIQNETTKLQMIAQLRQAEQALISEQRRERNMRILSSGNQGMPTIQ